VDPGSVVRSSRQLRDGCGPRLTGPGAAEIVGWVVGGAEEKRTFGAGDVDVGVVGVLAGEGEVASIWRPEGVKVVHVVVGELNEA
jgi:hypothetical protein